MILYSACPVCGSSAISKVLEAADHTATGEHFDIWQCAGCSIRFTQQAPEPNDIGKYYPADKYISHNNSGKGLIDSLYLFARRFTLRGKRRFVQRISDLAMGSLLDVGAGAGAFLHEMKTAGWNVAGVEPGEGARVQAANDYGLSLKTSNDLFQLIPQSFDVITLWHVLEHVHDLHRYVEQLKLLCKPTGKIIIAVPNYTSYDAEYYGSHWAAYDVPRHLYHFSPAAMATLITLHGCRLDSIHAMWLDSFYVSLLSEKYLSGSSGLVNGFWRGLQSNRKALRKRRKASSIIYVVSVPRSQVPA